MHLPDVATIQALRSDVALQIARCIKRRQLSQSVAAKLLRVPQPTLSKIMNGRVSELSLELLIRIAVRAGLPVVLQTGRAPEEAGAFVSGGQAAGSSGTPSGLAKESRDALIESTRLLSPEERLEAFLKHSELVTSLYDAGRVTEAARPRMRARPGRGSR